MTYKLKTPGLGIPVPKKEKLRTAVEWKKSLIIENMLLAGIQGVKFMVFEDGDYQVQDETDDTWMVTLMASAGSACATGIVGGAYFLASPSIDWKKLEKGSRYWLYLKGGVKTFEDSSKLRRVSSKHPLEGAHLLMATVDVDGNVNPYPGGKLYSNDIAGHVSGAKNPHGRVLCQDVLDVRKKLVLQGDLEVKDGDELLSISGASLAEMAKRQTEVLDFKSFGKKGGLKSVESGKVNFVQVQRRVVGQIHGQVGELAIGYYGQDPKVDMPSEFAVYNSGNDGIPLRALVLSG